MATFTQLSAAVALLLTLAALQLPAADGLKYIGINPFCRTASYRKTCTVMVKGATTWHDASVNVMRSALVVAKIIEKHTPRPVKLPPGTPMKSPEAQRNQVVEICRDEVESIVSDLETSLEALEENDIGTVRSHLSGSLRSDCKDNMRESNVDLPIAKYLGVMKRSIDNCLAVITQEF